MSAKILDGESFASQIHRQPSGRVEQLKARGVVPGLVFIRVGEDPASAIYVRNKRKACEEAGIRSVAYDLPADTIDVLDHVIRTSSGTTAQADINITRISVSTYATIPNKLAQGRPIQLWVKRLRDNPTVTVWPVPDQGTALAPYYVLRYWRLRRIQDAGNGVETPDVNFRFLPALASGLAYYIAMKVPELSERVPMLQQEYERQYDLAGAEDRERAAIRLVPRGFPM